MIVAVGQRIRELRTQRGLSLRECGKRADIHPFHIMAVELGQLAANTRTLRAIASALEVNPSDLLNTSDDGIGCIVEMMRTNPSMVRTVREHARRFAIN